jgi:hypothetical protein
VEGLSNFSPSVERLIQSQDVNQELNLYQTCAWIMWYMFLVQCEESRINHLTPLLVETMPYACWLWWWAYCIEDFKWRLHVQSKVAFWRVFWERGIFWRATSRLKGIEDFNLEHCRSSVTRPQSVLSVHCLGAILCGDTGFQVCEQTTGGALWCQNGNVLRWQALCAFWFANIAKIDRQWCVWTRALFLLPVLPGHGFCCVAHHLG